MKLKTLLPLALLALLILSGCVHYPSQKNIPSRVFSNKMPITILHTNDVHGHAWPQKGKDGLLRGGYAAQAALIDTIWKEVDSNGGITILLSAGDVNTGTPESDTLGAEPDFVAMNMIGYDAMVLGNHEFDRGLPPLQKQIGMAKFPVISGNVFFKKNNQLLAQAYTLIDKGGPKIGVLGLTTYDLPYLVTPSLISGLRIADPIQSAREIIPKMKARGAELIVALTHLGFEPQKSAGSSTQELKDDAALALEVPEIQVIVGGHTDTLLKTGKKVGQSIIVQAGGDGHHLGRLDLVWDQDAKKILSWKAEVIPVLPQNGEDAAIKEKMEAYKEKAGKYLTKQIGTSKTELNGKRELVRRQETNLGNFLCDVLREATQSDLVVYNGGGIRASISKGPIYIRDIYSVLPFGNTIVTATINGAQLKQALENGLKHQYPEGSFLQVSGVRYEAKGNKILKLFVGGKPVTPKKEYKMATNNFLLAGGDKFSIFTKTKNQRDTGIPVERFILDHLKTQSGPINPKLDGRIRLIPEDNVSD